MFALLVNWDCWFDVKSEHGNYFRKISDVMNKIVHVSYLSSSGHRVFLGKIHIIYCIAEVLVKLVIFSLNFGYTENGSHGQYQVKAYGESDDLSGIT